jgi:hypothetical protein
MPLPERLCHIHERRPGEGEQAGGLRRGGSDHHQDNAARLFNVTWFLMI